LVEHTSNIDVYEKCLLMGFTWEYPCFTCDLRFHMGIYGFISISNVKLCVSHGNSHGIQTIFFKMFSQLNFTCAKSHV